MSTNLRIRIGNQADIIASMRADLNCGPTPDYESIRSLGQIVMGFPEMVKPLPDHPRFISLLSSIGIERGGDIACRYSKPYALRQLRMIELLNAEEISKSSLNTLLRGTKKLAHNYTCPDYNYVSIVNHLQDPLGSEQL